MDAPSSIKTALRQRCMAARDALCSETQRRHAADFAQHALKYMHYDTPKIIAGYAARAGEMNIFPLLSLFEQQGHICCLPVIDPATKGMVFRQVETGKAEIGLDRSHLRKNAYGILEPDETCKEIVPDIVIVPLVSFDAAYNRIGNGHGYYDRYLHALCLAKRQNIPAIGAAFSCQQVEAIPAESHDIPLDVVITENGVI